ncbi:MAG TPA: tetratricopeptide repeat protein [Steroidobacteraceae bacterium]
MRTRHLGCIAALAAFSMSTAVAMANCQLQQLGTLPVDMQGPRPLIWTKINGAKARFILDSGAYYSMLWRDAAAQYRLRVTSVPGQGLHIVRGAGGDAAVQVTTVKSFEILGGSAPNLQFLVIDQSFGSDSAGLLGQNVLRLSDVEYDLANGILRFFKPVGCEHQPLAYWAVSTPYSSVDLQAMDTMQSRLLASAMVNGHRITVLFDTGSPRSYLSLDAAARVGISPNSPGATFLGLTGGVGPGSDKVWSATVDAFELGGEKVQHARLLVAEIDPQHQAGEISDDSPDMLLGEDFFLSHRIYVAYSQRKLYFTYNGGPLFNLNLPQTASSAATSTTTPGAASQPGATTAGQLDSDAPTDADGFRRRGMAFASMREFDRALADLTRACDLAPRDAQNHYQRAVAYAEAGRFKPALQDLDTAITLQPDDIEAHMARAGLLQSHPDTDPTDAAPEAKSDLDAVSRLAAPDANLRLSAGQIYGRLGDYPQAVDQIDQWLSHHPPKSDQAAGLNALCWLRATVNRDLQEALDDCNRALDLKPQAAADTGTLIGRTIATDDPDVLDSRALVYLRLGRPEDAVHDYASALQINPMMPTSLYGRGLAELQLGEGPQGQADLAAAEKVDKDVAQRFAKMGLAP